MRIERVLIINSVIFLAAFGVVSQPVFATPIGTSDISESDRLGARSDQYSRVFDKAIAALVKGDSAAFRVLLSSTTVLQETRGPGAIDAVIQNAYIPFFDEFAELTEEIATAPTFDAGGSSGIAIARSFKTKSGETKNFVIYLINEKVKDGGTQVVVGNLLLNATKDVFQSDKKGRKK
jgi:hypothetical protein